MQTYDYVIVGAGSAGCVLANRLSADPQNRVLLLEAGGPDHRSLRVRTPGLVGTLWRSRYDWTYFTSPQSGLLRRKMHWPRGKVLGGSSSINYMIYMRGHRDNFDHWRSLGNEGWGYEDVLPLFKRSENNVRGASAFHGADGPVDVTDVDANPMSDRLVEAAKDALLVPGNADFQWRRTRGCGSLSGDHSRRRALQRFGCRVLASSTFASEPHRRDGRTRRRRHDRERPLQCGGSIPSGRQGAAECTRCA